MVMVTVMIKVLLIDGDIASGDVKLMMIVMVISSRCNGGGGGGGGSVSYATLS